MRQAVDKLDAFVAIVLYGVSTWFSIKLFKELGGKDVADWLPFVLLAAGFEGTRAVLWIKGNMLGNRLFINFALFLTLLSLTASLANVLMTIEGAEAGTKTEAYQIEQDKKSLDRLEKQIEVEMKRLGEMPPEFVSASRTVRESIERKEVERAGILKRIEERENKTEGKKSEASGALFASVGRVLGFGERGQELFRLIFLMMIAGATEVSCLMLSKASVRRGDEVRDQGSSEVEAGSDGDDDEPEPVDRGEVQLEGEDQALDNPIRKIAEVLFKDGQYSRSAVFAGMRRACDEAQVSEEEYREVVKRGLLSGMLRRSKGKVYLSKGVTKGEFVKELESWPE